MIIATLIYPKKNLQWCNTKMIKIPANLFICEMTFKSYLRNLTKQIHNAMPFDWTKNSAPCSANARHKNSESIAHPFICYSDVVTLYEHNMESTDNSWQPKQTWIFSFCTHYILSLNVFYAKMFSQLIRTMFSLKCKRVH